MTTERSSPFAPGGTFSVAFPHVSSSMGTLKLEHIHAAQPDVLVSGDMSCLMHMSGLAQKAGQPIIVAPEQIVQEHLHRVHPDRRRPASSSSMVFKSNVSACHISSWLIAVRGT